MLLSEDFVVDNFDELLLPEDFVVDNIDELRSFRRPNVCCLNLL